MSPWCKSHSCPPEAPQATHAESYLSLHLEEEHHNKPTATIHLLAFSSMAWFHSCWCPHEGCWRCEIYSFWRTERLHWTRNMFNMVNVVNVLHLILKIGGNQRSQWEIYIHVASHAPEVEYLMTGLVGCLCLLRWKCVHQSELRNPIHGGARSSWFVSRTQGGFRGRYVI